MLVIPLATRSNAVLTNIIGTTLRIPIGYFTLGPEFCRGTCFEKYGIIYKNAWTCVKALVHRASAHGIGCLIDLHACPGGANSSEHSGTNFNKAELWTDRANLDLWKRCCVFLMQEITRDLPTVTGLQICNEATATVPQMFSAYREIFTAVASINAKIPLYISDGWNFAETIRYIGRDTNFSTAAGLCPIVIDTHLYWCFSQSDQSKGPDEIIEDVDRKIAAMMDACKSEEGAVGIGVIVGEYSCVMSEASWALNGANDRSTLAKRFGLVQSEAYQKNTGGCCFWTLKMDWMDGGEWGFVHCTKNGLVKPPSHLCLSADVVRQKILNASAQQEQLMRDATQSHRDYWSSQAGHIDQFWRYDYGWRCGWADALGFFGMRQTTNDQTIGGDKIGLLSLWVKKRVQDCNQMGSQLWQFEHGFRRGVQDFYISAGI